MAVQLDLDKENISMYSFIGEFSMRATFGSKTKQHSPL
jgi:hypothetical protein